MGLTLIDGHILNCLKSKNNLGLMINTFYLYLLVLESLPERQEVAVTHPRDIDSGSSHFWELLPQHGTPTEF